MAFTYDLTKLSEDSAAGRRTRVRLLIADTVNTIDQPNIFDDTEVDACLTLAGDDVYEAGAALFETWARSRGRIAKHMQRGDFATTRQAIKDLMDAADRIRATPRHIEAAGGVQTGEITGGGTGEYLDEIRAARETIPGLLLSDDEDVLVQG